MKNRGTIDQKERNFIRAAGAMLRTCDTRADLYNENKEILEVVKTLQRAMHLDAGHVYAEEKFRMVMSDEGTLFHVSFVDVIYVDTVGNKHQLAGRIPMRE